MISRKSENHLIFVIYIVIFIRSVRNENEFDSFPIVDSLLTDNTAT